MYWHKATCCAAISLLASGGFVSAQAATRYVDQNDENCCILQIDPNCTGTSNGPPFCRIEDAVAVSQDDDTIEVSAGTYLPVQNDSRPAGEITTSRRIRLISSEGADTTVIQAQVTFDGNGTRGSGRGVEGFTITSQGYQGRTDGISVSGHMVEIAHNRVIDNDGKGIMVDGSYDWDLVDVIDDNIVSGNGDSGIYISAANATISGGAVTGNGAGETVTKAAGIYLEDS